MISFDLNKKYSNENKLRFIKKPNDITLFEILNIVENYCRNLKWSILFLYAFGDLGENASIEDLEKTIENSKTGVILDWEELKNLSQKLDQVIDLVLIGSQNIEDLRKYQEKNEMYLSNAVVIEMHDSTYWNIFAKNKELISNLRERFKSHL